MKSIVGIEPLGELLHFKFNRTPQPKQRRHKESEKCKLSFHIENVELVHECYPQHLRMRTVWMKEDKQKRVNMKKNEYGIK